MARRFLLSGFLLTFVGVRRKKNLLKMTLIKEM